jgi:hypothetical protein
LSVVISGPFQSRRPQVEVEWTATDPDSGLLCYTPQRSSVRDYVARIEALLVLGEGYSELNWADRAYPHLTLSFRGGYGVVHRFSAEGKVFLLTGGDVIGTDDSVSVPVLDLDDVAFTGEYVLRAERAWAAVREFLRHGSVEDLGQWEEM